MVLNYVGSGVHNWTPLDNSMNVPPGLGFRALGCRPEYRLQ